MEETERDKLRVRKRERLKYLARTWRMKQKKQKGLKGEENEQASIGGETKRQNERDKEGDLEIEVEERKRYLCVPEASGETKRPQP